MAAYTSAIPPPLSRHFDGGKSMKSSMRRRRKGRIDRGAAVAAPGADGQPRHFSARLRKCLNIAAQRIDLLFELCTFKPQSRPGGFGGKSIRHAALTDRTTVAYTCGADGRFGSGLSGPRNAACNKSRSEAFEVCMQTASGMAAPAACAKASACSRAVRSASVPSAPITRGQSFIKRAVQRTGHWLRFSV